MDSILKIIVFTCFYHSKANFINLYINLYIILFCFYKVLLKYFLLLNNSCFYYWHLLFCNTRIFELNSSFLPYTRTLRKSLKKFFFYFLCIIDKQKQRKSQKPCYHIQLSNITPQTPSPNLSFRHTNILDLPIFPVIPYRLMLQPYILQGCICNRRCKRKSQMIKLLRSQRALSREHPYKSFFQSYQLTVHIQRKELLGIQAPLNTDETSSKNFR